MHLIIAIALLSGLAALGLRELMKKPPALEGEKYPEMLERVLSEHAENNTALFTEALKLAESRLKDPKKQRPSEKQIIRALYEVKHGVRKDSKNSSFDPS